MKQHQRTGMALLLAGAATLAALGAWAGSPPEGGVVEGAVAVTAPARPAQAAQGSGGFYEDDLETSSVKPTAPEEVVVYLRDVPGTFPPPTKHVHLDQKFIQFTHRVVPVLKGTVVDFTNHDPVYHNVFSNSKENKFDLGRKGYGQMTSVRMTRSEVPVKVYCEIHASMKSNILVLDNPFFTTVKPGGKFRLVGVPPGTYTLVAWHDYWAPVERQVTVTRGGTVRADLTLDKVQK